jgi:predicted nucleic acid-binding protein
MTEASPARVVADADVLAADLLVGGPAREALDHVRRHSWVTLVASQQLLDDAQAVIEELADPELAADWRERIEREAELVDHPAGDHPGLASAYRGGAAHLLSYDENLGSTRTGLSLQPHMQLSVRPPDAFAALFDPASLYEAVEGGAYPGPDRDPRD